MKRFSTEELAAINQELRDKQPSEILAWGIAQSSTPVVTTNFRPYESVLLMLCVEQLPEIPVIWCDSGYGTPETYEHAEELISALSLNMKVYTPKRTRAHRDVVMGLPGVDDLQHAVFTDEVKIEPFRRAMAEHQPDLWVTNLRQGQTALRSELGAVSQGNDGILKISPYFYWSDADMENFLKERDMLVMYPYSDPTKVEEKRECGLHLTSFDTPTEKV